MENPAYNPNGRQVLTAVVTSPSITSEILERIRAFNDSSPSYFVEIMDYKAEGARVLEAADLENRLPLEILSGKGPDLVIWNGYYTPALASEMLMMDLNDLMDADPDFHREDYFENILQAFERNGGLYIFPSSFAVSTMCGKAEELGADRGITESWEFGEILDAFENSSHAEVVFDYPNKEYTLNY
ncbi:MAG: extracellular solute-binding protein, partial [Acetatifactor sp.]|nr:extracellular solute-binding protein [Acetatifactor sp.]